MSRAAETDKREFEALKKDRELNWVPLWRDIGVYVHSMTTEFSMEVLDINNLGRPQNTKIFSTHAIKSNRRSAAALKAALWPEGGKDVKLIPSDFVDDTAVNKKYFEQINKVLRNVLSDSQNGLDIALDEFMVDQTAFGNGGIGIFDDPDTILRYDFWPIQSSIIAENKRGFIDVMYQIKQIEVYKMAAIYGEKNLSETLQEKMKTEEGKLEKVWRLICIRPNDNRDPLKGNNRNLPYVTRHYEFNQMHMLKEGGFKEFPVKFARMMKRGREVNGRGFGGDALPEIKELNFTREALILGIEKTVEPPLLIENDALLGNVIDTSPSAMNVIESDARSSENPIRPLFIVGDLRVAKENIEELKVSIDEHFMLDSLLDFNDSTRRTFGEIQTRQQLRGEGLTSVYNRLITEGFTPIITMTVNKLFDKGFMGFPKDSVLADAVQEAGFGRIEIPEQIMKLMNEGKPFYDIEYNTPAARSLKSGKASAIIETMRAGIELGQIDPTAMAALDVDKALRNFAESQGQESLVKAGDELKKIRDDIKKAQQQSQDNEALQAAAQSDLATAKAQAQGTQQTGI